MVNHIRIAEREIGPGRPAYLVAEMSANHNQDFNQAIKIIEAAKDAGADAVKLQTYTPATMTIDCDNEYFKIGKGTIWEGKKLYELYSEAYTPWEWQPKLMAAASRIGIDCFSTPFDATAADFLDQLNVPAFKVASFELVDLPLLKKIASFGKPVIVSTGMGSLAEIEEAVDTLRKAGCNELALMKCTSAYPASPAEMNLRTIPHLAQAFNLPVGISDHSLVGEIAIAGVALGACIVEKHFTLTRQNVGPDSEFSLEPAEFKAMAAAIRNAEKALGQINYKITTQEKASKVFRRSLFAVKPLKEGAIFTMENVRAIRPGYGLHTRYLPEILGKKAKRDITPGTPLNWNLIG